MNRVTYNDLLTGNADVIVRKLDLGILAVTGSDRATFLQGQLTNDVLAARQGSFHHACLLNNTGHIVADILFAVLEEQILLLTDRERLPVVNQLLSRFVVRERVEFTDVTGERALLALSGKDKERKISNLISEWAEHAINASLGVLEPYGRTLIVNLSTQDFNAFYQSLMNQEGVIELDQSTSEVFRIEAGIPKWGAELDESVIPLEAGLLDAISFTKGCYLGQEIIARIHSRGHTNRSLVGMQAPKDIPLDNLPIPVIALEGERVGTEIGKLTSYAESPTFGKIFLGFVRNEYSAPGTVLSAFEAEVTVRPLPFAYQVSDFTDG